jgi:hypothetical protein
MKEHPPCKECLKYPMCVGEWFIECHDLIKWLMEPIEDKNALGLRLRSFEEWTDKDISIITPKALCLEFKRAKDNHSCIIAT